MSIPAVPPPMQPGMPGWGRWLVRITRVVGGAVVVLGGIAFLYERFGPPMLDSCDEARGGVIDRFDAGAIAKVKNFGHVQTLAKDGDKSAQCRAQVTLTDGSRWPVDYRLSLAGRDTDVHLHLPIAASRCDNGALIGTVKRMAGRHNVTIAQVANARDLSRKPGELHCNASFTLGDGRTIQADYELHGEDADPSVSVAAGPLLGR